MNGSAHTPVLVAHDRPAEFRTRLERRFPGIDFAYATNGREILTMLDSLEPRWP